jgi:S-adenosylmethionine synthetase
MTFLFPSHDQAGDQGIMVGYATNENKNFMPENFNKCIILQKHLYKLQQKSHLLDLDSKVQITNFNDTFKIVVSTQHKQNANLLKLEKNIQKIIKKYITKNKFELLLNPSGSFVKGGIAADTGLTGRKIVADAYGSLIPVGGGAFSGKDPTKVDRSGAYAARHLAKNIVAHNLADKCLVRLSYAIGVAEPLEISINTFNTQKVKSVDLQNFINKFDMRPASIIERLDLLNVDYTKDTMFSHFGHNNRNWEKIENV